MAIPGFQSFLLPLLRYAAEHDQFQTDDAVNALVDQFGLTEDDRSQLLPSGVVTVLKNRVSWARTYLKKAGLITYPARGKTQITEEGRRVLTEDIENINIEYLKKYPAFIEFQSYSSEGGEEPRGSNPDEAEDLLKEFAEGANQWFQDRSFVVDYWKFFNEFFKSENLEKAEWTDIQKMGDNIHSLQSLELAKRNAFGNPNYPLEKYRESFQELAHGKGSVEERMRWFLTDKTATSKYLGPSSVSEIMGQLHADNYVFFNRRNKDAAQYLGIDPGFARGDDDATKFVKFNKAIKPLLDAFKEVVGSQVDIPIGPQLDQFFSWLYETKDIKPPPPPQEPKKTWEFAPGRGAMHWDAFVRDGVAAIGWNDIPDLRQYESREEVARAIKETLNPEKEPINDSLAMWQICHEMKPGDIIIAKKGRRTLLGRGVVEGDYAYLPDREDYFHVRKVRWEKTGTWKLPEDLTLTMKALTDLSSYPVRVSRLNALIDDLEYVLPGIGYWWLNCNPSVWRPSEHMPGDRVVFTAFNESGNKRQKYEYFEQVSVGDPVIAYETAPVKKVTTLLEVVNELGDTPEGLGIELEVKEQLANQSGMDIIKSDEKLFESEPILNNQGTLFSLTEHEFNTIREISSDLVPIVEDTYEIEDALYELFMPEGTFKKILEQLEVKKNVILQGPPGVGKTFVAQRVAFAMMGLKDRSRVKMVQFHQSYSYEDFVRGFRPSEDGGFSLVDGVFYRFCQQARNDDRPHFFIIDEINRGNLSKILGELMMLIEHDKRTPQYATSLAYHRENEKPFYVPSNVYLIGLMNTADRSLAMVDYALRRRFSFIDLEPEFGSDKFVRRLRDNSSDGLGDRVIEAMRALNEEISLDTDNLGSGFCVGHSYFCLDLEERLDGPRYRRIIETEIAPLLREYWFDQPQTANEWTENLLAVAG